MSDATPQRWSTNAPSEPIAERNDRIFRSLPPLDSPEYLSLLNTASAAELPAGVLVRVYRSLGGRGRAAEATLRRLLTQSEHNQYLLPLVQMAERRLSARDWFGLDDLVTDAVTRIGLALAGPQGKGADTAWVSFLKQRLEDAYRALNGRRGERRDPERAKPHTDPRTGVTTDPMEGGAVQHAPWHGRVEPDKLVWLEKFMRRTMARVPDQKIREVGLDQISAEPSAISGPGSPGKPSLATRYGVTRFRIMRWRDLALGRLLAALETQNECELDVGWLREAFAARRGAADEKDFRR